MFISCSLWTVARTKRGTAVLLREQESQKSIALYLTTVEAQIILNNMKAERPESHLFNFIDQLLQGSSSYIKRIEICEKEKGKLTSWVRIGQKGDDFTIGVNPAEAVALAARFSCPVEVEKTYFNRKGININLIDIERARKKKKLTKKLQRLVDREDYENAAQVRDEIISLEKIERSEDLT